MENILIIKLEIGSSDYYNNYDLSLLDYNATIDLQVATNQRADSLFPVVLGYEPTIGEKLFFAKGVNIPRVNLKILQETIK